MDLQQKQEAVANLEGLLSSSQGAFVVAYQGCTCEELTGVRAKLREQGAEFAVVKNTLAKRAVSGTPAENLSEHLQGPTALVWAKDNLVEPAKIITDFAKDKEPFEVKGGYVDGEVVDSAQVTQLAKMPSKKELQAKLLSLLNAPAVQVLNILNAPSSNVVRLLGAWKSEIEKKES